MKRRSLSLPHFSFTKAKETVKAKKGVEKFTLRRAVLADFDLQKILFRHLPHSFIAYNEDHAFDSFVYATDQESLKNFYNAPLPMRIVYFNLLPELYSNLSLLPPEVAPKVMAIVTAYLGIFFESKAKIQTPEVCQGLFTSTVKILLKSIASLKIEVEKENNLIYSLLQESERDSLNDTIKSQLSILNNEVETRNSLRLENVVDKEAEETKENERAPSVIIKKVTKELAMYSENSQLSTWTLAFLHPSWKKDNSLSSKLMLSLLPSSLVPEKAKP